MGAAANLPEGALFWQLRGVFRGLASSAEGPRTSAHGGAESRWFAQALGPVVAVLAFGVTMARASGGPQFASDLAALRDLGLVGIGVGGYVSSLVTALCSLVPLGSREFRAALGSGLALATAAWLLSSVGASLLRSVMPSRHRAPLLAAVASLITALAPTWQRAGTAGGGCLVAVALSLASLHAHRSWETAPRASPAGSLARSVFGLWMGALVAESPATALALGLALALAKLADWRPRRSGSDPTRPSRLGGWLSLAMALFTAALLATTPLLRAYSLRPWTDLGRGISASWVSTLGATGAAASSSPWDTYLRELGLVALVAGAGGALVALLRGRKGRDILPLLLLVGVDVGIHAMPTGSPWIDAAPLRALALASLAIGTAAGVHTACAWMWQSGLPLARSAEVLTIAFHLTLAALASEEASFQADRSEQHAAEAWTDLALARLAPSAALVLDSPEQVARLWAARFVRGERPDVLLLPSPLLQDGALRRTVAEREPGAAGLLRDIALSGSPSEFGLSSLADGRALYLQPQPSWPDRLASHLALEGPWARYVPQPIGRSDRRMMAASMIPSAQRVLDASRAASAEDEAATGMVVRALQAQVGASFQLGETEGAQLLVDQATALAPGDARLNADAFAPFLKPPVRVADTARVLRRR